MKYSILQFLSVIFLLWCFSGALYAQGEPEEETRKVQFNGLGRATILNTGLDGEILDTDTSSVRNLSDGEFLLDLAINATPNDVTEVQGILRLRNEFGGFFGAGVTVEVRELWARGIIANVLDYRVGDMDIVMTPYTFFLPEEEAMVNEPEIFRPQKEIIYYEQFYGENNERRMQGGKLDFGLEFTKGLEAIDFSGFIARVRGTDFFTVPNRFVSGGTIDLSTPVFGRTSMKGKAGLNLVHTFDDLESGEANSGIRNTIYTVDFDLRLYDKENLGIHLIGEAGMSSLEFKNDSLSVFKKEDNFIEVGAKVDLKEQNLVLSATFIDVGPDFFSTAAQSRRVALDRTKTYYNRIGNDRRLRMPSLFDLGRDRALYTFQLSDRLMPYDPRYSNVQPYGKATPNRRGLRVGVDYNSSNEALEARVDASLLREIRGQGTFELKDLRLIRGMANLNFHRMAEWRKILRLTLGYQYEQSSRDGNEVEQVDLTSNLIEIGLEAELIPRLDLLAGAKLLSSEGNEYVPLIEEYNDVKDFPAPYLADDSESLLGAGLRYRFKENVYLTLQYQRFSFSRKTDSNPDYELNQLFVQYSMDF